MFALDAAMFAIKAHGDQKYGTLPYAYHLAGVVSILEESGIKNPDILKAGWLHDVCEDTKVSLDVVSTTFGEEVGRIVWACTGIGPNRQSRNRAIVRKLTNFPKAMTVKVADHIFNMDFSVETKSELLMLMYAKESDGFNLLAKHLLAEPWLYLRLMRSTLDLKQALPDSGYGD